MLKLDRVDACYASFKALDGIDMTIEAGETVFVDTNVLLCATERSRGHYNEARTSPLMPPFFSLGCSASRAAILPPSRGEGGKGFGGHGLGVCLSCHGRA